MEINVIQEIAYRQLLTRAGFKVHAMTGMVTYRGSGVGLQGSFERDGKLTQTVGVKARGDAVIIDGQVHKIVTHADGGFDLLTWTHAGVSLCAR